MTNPNYTAIMLLVDRSGSMISIRVAAESGVNEFITSQAKATGKRTIRIAQFDYSHAHGGMRYDTICPSTPAADVKPFTLEPDGLTPLLDAMARSITEFGDELAALPEPERPGVVIYAVLTDGIENSSRDFGWPEVKAMLERQQNEYGWQVVYLGANQDAFAVGEQLGVPRASTMTYAASDDGTRSVLHSLDSYVVTASAAPGTRAAFTDEQRDEANPHPITAPEGK